MASIFDQPDDGAFLYGEVADPHAEVDGYPLGPPYAYEPDTEIQKVSEFKIVVWGIDSQCTFPGFGVGDSPEWMTCSIGSGQSSGEALEEAMEGLDEAWNTSLLEASEAYREVRASRAHDVGEDEPDEIACFVIILVR